jgi:hypothetical protein
MFIKDIKALTNFNICPKSKTYFLSKSTFKDHKERFDKHVDKCDGKYHFGVNIKLSSLPYHPTLPQNSEYLKLYKEGKQDQYEFTRDYICFDFETVENVINQSLGGKKEASTWNATLIPITVAWATRYNGETEIKSSYRGQHSVMDFISEFLNGLFTAAKPIYNRLKARKKTSETEEEEEDDDEEDEPTENEKTKKEKKRRDQFQVKVLGFNSRKFDTNLFVRNI